MCVQLKVGIEGIGMGSLRDADTCRKHVFFFFFFYFYPVKGTRSKDSRIKHTYCHDIAFQMPFSPTKKQASLEK